MSSSTESAVGQPPRLSTEERTDLLARAIQDRARRGWRVQAQGPTQATLVKGKPTNHILHLILSLLTLGLWLVVWLGVVIFAGEKSVVVTVDEQGRVKESR